jgi:hypothetical protein
MKDELAARRGMPMIAITGGAKRLVRTVNIVARERLVSARLSGLTITEYLAERRRRRFRAIEPMAEGVAIECTASKEESSP